MEKKIIDDYSVVCPLCSARMWLTILDSENEEMEKKSYIWICEDCPGILLEWWHTADTDAFVNYSLKRKGLIKQWDRDLFEETYGTNQGSKTLLKEGEGEVH